MSKKIIGVTVGTPISPSKIEDKIKPIKSINGITPDENGDVEVRIGLTEEEKAMLTSIVSLEERVQQYANEATVYARDAHGYASDSESQARLAGEAAQRAEEAAQRAEEAANNAGGESTPGVVVTEIDPSKIIFPNGVKTTYEIGKVKLKNGIGELISPGGNLNEFFEKFMDEQPPETTDPSVSITFNQAKAYEVGTKVTPSYSASFEKGSYTYDEDTGVTVSEWSVKDTNNNSSTDASGSFPEITVSDGINYKITATATHGAGIVPKTNTGKSYADGQIKAGSKSATSGALTGYRNTFYGTLTAKTEPTSSVIRGLAGKSGKSLTNGSSFTVTIPVGALRVVIAYPATLRDITSIKDVNGMNAEISSGFNKQTISVEGANSYEAKEYKVYTMDFANENDTANKFTVTI